MSVLDASAWHGWAMPLWLVDVTGSGPVRRPAQAPEGEGIFLWLSGGPQAPPGQRKVDRHDVFAMASCAMPATRMEMDGRASVAIVHLLQKHSTAAERAHREGGLAPWQLAKVSAAMTADLSRPHPIKELAAVLGLSHFDFCRAFHRSAGLPPNEWLIEQRMPYARRLLSCRGASIAGVAAAVGYQDAGHFSRLFKRHLGLRPSDFRRMSRVR